MKPFYRLARATVGTLTRLAFGVKVYGLENLNFEGPAVLASNHISLLDPPLIGSWLPFEIHFMAKSELFANRWLGPVISRLNAFPVKRGLPDRAALETAGRLLTEGKRILMFPEGTRQKDGKLVAPKLGAAQLALRYGVPMVPLCVRGTNQLRRLIFSRRCIQLAIGAPLETNRFAQDLSEKDRARELTERVMAEVGKLQEGLKSQGRAGSR